jgi:very-short-patch-repair endonuclease
MTNLSGPLNADARTSFRATSAAMAELRLERFGLVERHSLPEREQRAMLSRGDVSAPIPGLLAKPASGIDAWWQELALRVADSWPHVAVSRESAAALWGLDSFEIGAATLSVDAIRRRSVRSPGVHRPVRPIDITMVPTIPFPVTTPIETILGLAGTRFQDQLWITRPERLEIAIESGLRLGLFTWAELRNAIENAPRTLAGKAMLREFLRDRPEFLAPTESFLETRTVQVLRRGEIRHVARQVEIADANGRIGRVDILVEDVVVVECDSILWHHNPDSFKSDRVRRARLLAIGYPVIEATFDRVGFDPEGLIRDVKAAVRFAKAGRSGAGFSTFSDQIRPKSA